MRSATPLSLCFLALLSFAAALIDIPVLETRLFNTFPRNGTYLGDTLLYISGQSFSKNPLGNQVWLCNKTIPCDIVPTRTSLGAIRCLTRPSPVQQRCDVQVTVDGVLVPFEPAYFFYTDPNLPKIEPRVFSTFPRNGTYRVFETKVVIKGQGFADDPLNNNASFCGISCLIDTLATTKEQITCYPDTSPVEQQCELQLSVEGKPVSSGGNTFFYSKPYPSENDVHVFTSFRLNGTYLGRPRLVINGRGFSEDPLGNEVLLCNKAVSCDIFQAGTTRRVITCVLHESSLAQQCDIQLKVDGKIVPYEPFTILDPKTPVVDGLIYSVPTVTQVPQVVALRSSTNQFAALPLANSNATTVSPVRRLLRRALSRFGGQTKAPTQQETEAQ